MRLVKMSAERTIFDEPHYQSLELLATRELTNGDPASAFKYADRRCRIIPVPEPHCYVLRGEASFRLGDKEGAIADIRMALGIAPDDITANRRMLAWGRGPDQTKAACAIVRRDRDFDYLRKAVGLLRARGQKQFARVTVLDDAVEGWAIWYGGDHLEISITDGADVFTTMFSPRDSRPVGRGGRAVGFKLRRPKSSTAQSITLSVDGDIFHATRTAGNDVLRKCPSLGPRAPNISEREVTVIVPVYADYKATKLCLEGLRNEVASSSYRTIVIDDAAPDPRIGKYLAQFGKADRIEVLINQRNRGFVGSVNRALELVSRGDIVILNSDTIVPPGFINRLAEVAWSSPEIGTVTPFSNNGEFTSFPTPNRSNPLPSRREIERFDRIAAKVNARRVIDIPSGIGFCLYVTRPCLDAVGLLSEDFGLGYLEDADFCLRARERGFRNVCAPSIYVGHAGSKSFGSEKRSLVVRNLGVLEQRFPDHRSECAAFIAADPLRPARQAVEREEAGACHPMLLVTGGGVVEAIARKRARQVATRRNPVFILEVRDQANGTIVRIADSAGGLPQSVEFALGSPADCRSLSEFLSRTRPRRAEFIDPANTPPILVDLLLKLKVPYDVFIADTGLLGPATHQSRVKAIASRREAPCNEDVASGLPRSWRDIAGGAEQILVPCEQARAFAATVLPRGILRRVKGVAERCSMVKRARRKRSGGQIGFLPVRSCAEEHALLGALAQALVEARPDVSITVIGATFDDINLMRQANVFVTAAIEPDEFERLIFSLGVGRLFVSATRPLFGHPILSAVRATCLPTAYFDWSNGCCKSNKRDLPIDPGASLGELVDAVSRWMR